MRSSQCRSQLSVAAAAASVVCAALSGARPVDAVLSAVPALLLLVWPRLPPAERVRLLAVQLPVLAVAAVVGGVALGANQAAALGAPVPWLGGLRFGGYLLLWCVGLR